MIKCLLFCGVLLYAAYVDYKRLVVPTHVHFLLLGIGLLDVSLSAFAGAFVAFFPLFLVAALKGGIGGGDVKLAGMCGFVMHGLHGLLGITLGILLAMLVVPLWRLLTKQKIDAPIALVPYLSAGCILITVIVLI